MWNSAAPGSLLLWMHPRAALNFSDAYSTGCPGAPAVPVRVVLRQNLRATLNQVKRHRLFSRMKNQLREK